MARRRSAKPLFRGSIPLVASICGQPDAALPVLDQSASRDSPASVRPHHVIDPQDPARLCISQAGSPGTLSSANSAGNNGVYCSSDSGENWAQLVTPTKNLAVDTLAVDPRDFGVMYAWVNGGPCSSPAPVCERGTYFNTRGAAYKTTDGGATWTELDAGYVKDQRVTAVRVDANDPQTVISATFGKLPIR